MIRLSALLCIIGMKLKGLRAFILLEDSMHSPEKRNGSSGLTARRSASVERCKMAVTRDWDFSCFFR